MSICVQRAGRVCARPGDLHPPPPPPPPPSGCPYRSPCIGEARQSNKHRAVTLRHGGSVCVRVCLHVCS